MISLPNGKYEKYDPAYQLSIHTATLTQNFGFLHRESKTLYDVEVQLFELFVPIDPAYQLSIHTATLWQNFGFLHREAKTLYDVEVQLFELFVPITDSQFYDLSDGQRKLFCSH